MNHADDDLLAAALRRRMGGPVPSDAVEVARDAVVHRAGRVRRRRAIAAGSLASLAIVVGTAALVSGADGDEVVRTPADRPEIGVVDSAAPRPTLPERTTVTTIDPPPSPTATTTPTTTPIPAPVTSAPAATAAPTTPPAAPTPGSPLTTVDDHGGDDGIDDSGSNGGTGSSNSGSSGGGPGEDDASGSGSGDDDSSGSGRDGTRAED